MTDLQEIVERYKTDGWITDQSLTKKGYTRLTCIKGTVGDLESRKIYFYADGTRKSK